MKPNSKKLLATILSILVPGAGQIFKGQKYKAFIGYSIFFLLPILFFALKLQYYFVGFILLIMSLVALYFINIFDAFFGKIAQQTNKKILLGKWIVFFPILFFVIDAYAISKHLNNEDILGIRVFKVPSGSMIPTCKIGDMIVFSINYYKSVDIQMGDIVTFNHNLPNIIKRAIAFPGDTVEIRNKELYINTDLINEPYVVFLGKQNIVSEFNRMHQFDNFIQKVIPENKLFVLGDNRDISYDSRDPSFGLIDIKSVNHKPLFILWSKDKSRIGKKIK